MYTHTLYIGIFTYLLNTNQNKSVYTNRSACTHISARAHTCLHKQTPTSIRKHIDAHTIEGKAEP